MCKYKKKKIYSVNLLLLISIVHSIVLLLQIIKSFTHNILQSLRSIK
jgi:hypothetical protein